MLIEALKYLDENGQIKGNDDGSLLAKVKDLLKKGANVNAVHIKDNSTALHYAEINNANEEVKELFKKSNK